MKKLFLLLIVMFAIQTMAQEIPNAGFEDWQNEEPVSWNTLDQNFFGIEYDMVTEETNDVFSGNSSIRLESVSNYIIFQGDVTMPGMITLGEIEADILAMDGNIYGGVPYTGYPISMSGYYKYTPAEGDTAAIGLVTYRWNNNTRDTLAGALFSPSELVEEWTEFEAVMEYVIWGEADTLNIIASSTAVEADELPVGSVLLIDELSLNYGPVSTIEPDLTDSFRVYPNLISQHLNIELDYNEMKPCHIQLFNINGILIKSTQQILYQGKTQFPYHEVASGIYVIRLTTPNGESYSQKVRIN